MLHTNFRKVNKNNLSTTKNCIKIFCYGIYNKAFETTPNKIKIFTINNHSKSRLIMTATFIECKV